MSSGNYIAGYGPSSDDVKLMIVGIAPGAEEEGRPFVGPSGNILRKDLSDAGISLDSTYRTNVFKFKLPGNEFKRYQEIGLNLADSMADLTQEINTINPNVILGLGDPVLYALAGKSGKHNNIGTWRGSIIPVLGRKAIFTWHPSAELHGEGEGQWKTWQRYIRKFDIKRAVEQIEFPEFPKRERLFHICSSSSDLLRYLERNEDKPFAALDIEAIENIPVCLGIAFSTTEAMIVPLWNQLNINCINSQHSKKSYKYDLTVSTIPTGDLAHIYKLLAKFLLNPRWKKIGQNFKYDEDKINKLGFFLDKLYWDIMLGQHCISSELPKSLAFMMSINTLNPYHKMEGKEFNPRKDKISDFFNYCGEDCVNTLEIALVQMKELSEIPFGLEHMKFRMELHKAYLEVDKTGFQTDELAKKELIFKYVTWLVRLEKELEQICISNGRSESINIGSWKQVDYLLYDLLKIPRRKGTGEEVITAILGNIAKSDDQIRACEIILEWRRVDKTLGYLKARPDYDNRMKTTFRICGTENFRTSTNILEPPIRPEKIGWAFQTITKHGDIGQDLRTQLVADKGYVIVNIDQSQAEARVCSLLADDEITLLEYDTIDKHAYTASKFFSQPYENFSKKLLGYECPERFVGKTLRHAYHLGIGKHEAMINVNTDARKYGISIRISEWKANECLKILEKDTPKIQTVFHETIKELLRSNRRLYGTFNSSRYFYDDEGRDLWKGAYSFIPQQTVSDKTKQVLVKVVKYLSDVKVCVEAHDALTFQIKERLLDERIEQIQEWFSIPIGFENCSIPRRELVIPTEVEIGYNYCELKKYKRKEI